MHERAASLLPPAPCPGTPLSPGLPPPHEAALPDVDDPFPILRFSGPDGDLVPLGTDVDDSPAHLITVIIKHLPNEAHQLPGGE